MKDMNRTIVDIIMNQYGMDISMFDELFVRKTISLRLNSLCCNEVIDYSDFISKDKKEAELFVSLLFVNYSEFFRNTLTFSVLENIVLPEILYKKRNSISNEIRIWSAACSDGREAYSLAIILKALIRQDEKITYRIFGTDQDINLINLAQVGEYSIESLGNVKLKQLQQWFIQSGNNYTVIPELKQHCDFSVFDLLSKHNSPPESIFGDFDLVFCANVLFYYKQSHQKLIIEKLCNTLSVDGLLITGETERAMVMACNFEEIYPNSAIFRKKSIENL